MDKVGKWGGGPRDPSLGVGKTHWKNVCGHEWIREHAYPLPKGTRASPKKIKECEGVEKLDQTNMVGPFGPSRLLEKIL